MTSDIHMYYLALKQQQQTTKKNNNADDELLLVQLLFAWIIVKWYTYTCLYLLLSFYLFITEIIYQKCRFAVSVAPHNGTLRIGWSLSVGLRFLVWLHMIALLPKQARQIHDGHVYTNTNTKMFKSSIHTHSNWLHNHSSLSLILILFNHKWKQKVPNARASEPHTEWHIKLWYVLSYVLCFCVRCTVYSVSRHILSRRRSSLCGRTLFYDSIRFNCFGCCWLLLGLKAIT